MGSPERGRTSIRREIEEDVEVNIDIVKDEEDWVGDDKRKQRSSRSRKTGSGDEVDGLDGSGRKRNTSDRHESRKRSGGSSRADSDLDDYDTRKESRSKQVKKKSEENTLDVLSSWYLDGDAENKLEGGDKSGSRGYTRAEESERKKSTSKYSENDADVEKVSDRDSRDLSKRDSIREKGYGYSEHGRSHRRRWDEPDKSSDPKLESASERERTDSLEIEPIDKSIKSYVREERRADSERSKRGRSEFLEEDNKGSSTRLDISSKERFEEHRQQRTPEKRRQFESDNSEMDYERSSRRKELGKDSSWDDRSKGRDDSWKRKQDKETRESETTYDGMRDWELPRRGRDRIDGRPGGRKDGNRTEAVKTSSKYGISNENYDVIEIQTKPFDYAREDSRSNQQSESRTAPDSEEFTYSRERNTQGPAQSSEDAKDRFMDGDLEDNENQADKSRGQKGNLANRPPSSSGVSLTQHGRGNKIGSRVGRGRPTGRDGQQTGMPTMPLVGSRFGPLGLPPPGPMQSLPPNMSPAPGPISPGVFIPPFQPPIVWPGARGVEMNMLGVPPGLPPVPPGPMGGPRFSPHLGNVSGSLGFSPSGPGRGMPPNILSGPNFNPMAPRANAPPRTNAPPGKAPSRGEQNDYSQNFVDTGMRPQNFIRELELTSVVEDYPKLRELIQKKDEIVSKSASPPMYYKCDLKEQVLSPELFGTKFDVILVDPPWEEYVHRAPGVSDHMDYWTFEEIMNLKIEAIADTPSFIFLWVGDGVGLEQGRQCLKKWGFRRCEDICWVKTNKTNAAPGLRHDSHTLFQRSKEHCLMGIKGTVRRSTDGHIIHANIDTDVIIAEEPPYGSTAKPEDMYRIIEHFALGRRRLELFGEDHNIRSGWLTIGKGLTSSNFKSEAYVRNFADKDGKVWLGGGGRNPPPEAPHLVLTTPEIESLRPKSPMKNQQQLQSQQSATISLTTANSGNKRPTTGNSPQNHSMNQEASSSNMASPAPWASSPMEAAFKPTDERMFDMYGYNNNVPFGPASGEFLDYETHRGMNML